MNAPRAARKSELDNLSAFARRHLSTGEIPTKSGQQIGLLRERAAYISRPVAGVAELADALDSKFRFHRFLGLSIPFIELHKATDLIGWN